jgi:hypothetical protein
MGRQRYTPQEQAYYRNYINSAKWRLRKEARIAKAGGRCEFVTTHYLEGGPVEVRCGRTRYLCVHHNTYERLGDESDKDLDVYCWIHHMVEHLLWKKCHICGEPCLGYDSIAEQWLEATMLQMGVDFDTGNPRWNALPTKEQLAEQIHHTCFHCRGIELEKP